MGYRDIDDYWSQKDAEREDMIKHEGVILHRVSKLSDLWGLYSAATKSFIMINGKDSVHGMKKAINYAKKKGYDIVGIRYGSGKIQPYEPEEESTKKFGKKFTKENVEAMDIEELYEELKVKYGIKKPRYLDNDTFLEMDGGQIFCGLDRSEFPGVRTYTKANNQFCQELVGWMKENHPDFEVEWEPGDAKTGNNEPVLIYKIEPRRMLEKFDESMNWRGVTSKQSPTDPKKTIFTRTCPMCGKLNSIEVDTREIEDGMSEYGKGAMIQDAFPNLTPDEREFFLSGICNDCWGNL